MVAQAERLWTDEHGADGLRDKFHTYKPKDVVVVKGSTCPAYKPGSRLGADGEFVFVLRPEYDLAAWLALREYAHEVEHRAPQLAADIREMLRIIRIRNDQATD